MSEDRSPLAPLSENGLRPATSEILRLLLDAVESRWELDSWLPFPQTMCCFHFGFNRQPLPIGALLLLWSAGPPFVQTCPRCGSKIYMTSFGGLLSSGGGHLVCVGCGESWFQFIGGLGRVAKFIAESPIGQSPYRPKGMAFGRAYASDGAELRRILGAKLPPDAGDRVSFRIVDGPEISVDLEFERREYPKGPPRDGGD